MKKTLVALALAALPALMLSACNGSTTGGSTGVAPLPNAPNTAAQEHSHRGKMHSLDSGPQDLHAGGATFPAYAYNLGNQPVGPSTGPQAPPGQGSLFFAAPTHGTVYYCLTGSGFGRKEFESNNGTATVACQPLGATPSGFGARQDPLDFVGSDVAMPQSEVSTYVAGRQTGSQQWGDPFEFPTIGGPIVYGYRPHDFVVPKLKFSVWTYCAIANGVISDWNDAAITQDNGGQSVTGGVSEPITFYFRSDSSGTSYLYTYHLNTACNVTFKAPYNHAPYGSPSRSAAWPYGFNSTWPGPGSSGVTNPNFIGESGNPGVLAAIQSTPFSTGYVEGAWAKSANPKVAQALLMNGKKNGLPDYVDPTNKTAVLAAFKKIGASDIQFGMGSDGVPLGFSHPNCQLYIDPSKFTTPPKGAYPIEGLSYWLFYGQNNGVHVSDKIALINFLVNSTQANKLISKLEYVPLSASIHTAVTTALNGNGTQSPCLQ